MKPRVTKLSKQVGIDHKKPTKAARKKVKGATRKRLEEDALIWLRNGSESDAALKRKIARIPDEPLEKLISHMNKLAAETVQLNEQIALSEARAEELKAKADQMKRELELIDEQKERARLTDEWIRKVEDGDLDEPFPFYFAKESLDELGSELIPEEIGRFPAEDLEKAARESRDPVKLWETAVMIVGSPRSASKLIELAQRVLMILSLRSGFGPIARENDVSGAGALLGKFYAGLLPGIRELSKDRTKLPGKPKNLLGNLYQSSRQFREAFEHEVAEHGRTGWAADAARTLLVNVERWSFGTLIQIHREWVEQQCKQILSPNPYPPARYQVTPWEKVWSKEDWLYLDVANSEAGDDFRREWKALWTDERLDALARYKKPKTEAEFIAVWKVLFTPLACTIPPAQNTTAKRKDAGGRLSSVNDALRARLGMQKRRETK